MHGLRLSAWAARAFVARYHQGPKPNSTRSPASHNAVRPSELVSRQDFTPPPDDTAFVTMEAPLNRDSRSLRKVYDLRDAVAAYLCSTRLLEEPQSVLDSPGSTSSLEDPDPALKPLSVRLREAQARARRYLDTNSADWDAARMEFGELSNTRAVVSTEAEKLESDEVGDLVITPEFKFILPHEDLVRFLSTVKKLATGVAMTYTELNRIKALGLFFSAVEARKVLHSLKIFDECSDYIRRRHEGIFVEPQLSNVDREVMHAKDPFENFRSEFTARALAIDSVETFEVDDAVSLVKDPKTGQEWIYVHAADVTRFMSRTSKLHQETSKRVVTHYLPDKVWPMIHRDFVDVATLAENRPCPTFTVGARLAPDGSIAEKVIRLFSVPSIKRVTFHQVEAQLQALGVPLADANFDRKVPTDPPPWFTPQDRETLLRFSQIAELRREYRTRNGARFIEASKNRLKITHSSEADPAASAGESGEIASAQASKKSRLDYIKQLQVSYIRDYDLECPAARALVEELMLLAGEACAEYAVDNKLLLAYRCDSPKPEFLVNSALFSSPRITLRQPATAHPVAAARAKA
eukprot:RCo053468